MNKYKVIYYVVVIALLVSVFLLIGMDLPVIEWIEKKSKNLASEKGE